jgi:hypothetical protein
MEWQKLGLIFDPVILKNKSLSAALMPIAKIIDQNEGIIKVYYCPRNSKNESEVHWFKFNINDPFTIIEQSPSSVYEKGDLGCFDDSGITSGSIVNGPDCAYYYYTGWNLTVKVPMNNSIGMAKIEQEDNFKRIGPGPILTRNLFEPNSCSSPFVLYEDSIFRMWYVSMDKWVLDSNNVPKHYYNIKYAESQDGINWDRQCKVCIDYQNDSEYAFGRPFILNENEMYKMWYSVRGDYYVIGYAESVDGIHWERKDNLAGITVSENGWDSEMIEYPFIFDWNNNRYMLYNGNGYGKTGIGLAILENE